MVIRNAASLATISLMLQAAGAVAQPAVEEQETAAQVAGADNPEVAAGDEILVVATRLRGQVDTTQPPIVTLDEEQIAAYGAGSIQELLTSLAPQTGSGRGRGDGAPLILLNGMRISSFREMRGLPPEAIRRVEVLPEEVALKYGYRPDQRVVNFILKDNFRAYTTETEVRLPGSGGYAEGEQEVSLVRIDGASRINVNGALTDSSPLTEAERGIVQPAGTGVQVAGDPLPGDYRTLLPDSRSAAVNATWARALGGGAGLSINGLFEREHSRDLNGLDSVTLVDGEGTAFQRTLLSPEALTTRQRTTTAQVGLALNKPLGGWLLALTADGGRVETDTRIDRRATLSGLQALVDAGSLAATGAIPASAFTNGVTERAIGKVDTLNSLLTASGAPARLPGGEISLTVKGGYSYSGISRSDTRSLAAQPRLTRHDAQVGFSADVPITSRRENFGTAIGDLSLNFNGELHDLSDFGTLKTYGGGLTWKPTEKLTLQATYVGADAAPTLSQLGAPVVETPAVAVYDFSRNETVLATVLTGGNTSLLRERQRDLKFSANWTLPFMSNSSLLVEYFRNRSNDTTNAFPVLTPQVEAAFPGRVVRDAAGRIVSVDQRPVTFARESGSRLRYGINLSGQFGTPDPAAARGGPMGAPKGGQGALAAGRPPGAGPGAGAGGGPRMGRGFGPGRGDGRGRWNLSLTHTIRLQQEAQIVAGGPVFNLLDGDALAQTGVARHAVQLEGGGFYRGFGLRLTGNYTGGSRIDASGLPGSSTLRFAPIATFDIRLFADLGRKANLVEAVPFLKGSRVSLSVDNLFNAQQRVTDASGVVPLGYQPGYLDPAGQVFELEFRKQF